jgi:hypothetical protein
MRLSSVRLSEMAAVQGWELFAALMFHNLTIILSAWIGFIIGRRTMEMDEMERFIQAERKWNENGS